MTAVLEEAVTMRFDPSFDPAWPAMELKLAALPNAVGCARRFVRHTLRTWLPHHATDLNETVELVTSELVTNAIQATGITNPRPRYTDLYKQRLCLVILRLRHAGASVLVEVWDNEPDPPAMHTPSFDSEGGRGLLLVDAFSTTWGHYHPPTGGKVVWAELLITDFER